MQFNYNVKPLDIGAYFRGLDRYEARQKEEQAQAQKEQLQQLGQSFLGGDASALEQIAAINLPYAAQLQQFQQSQQPQAASDDEILGAMENAASFLRNGQVASAQQSIQQLIPRLQDQAQQREMLGYIQQMETDPQGLLRQYDSAFSGGEKFAPDDATKKFNQLQSIRAEYGEDSPQAMEYERLIQLRDTPELSSGDKKVIDREINSYSQKMNSAAEARALANQLDSNPFSGGAMSSWASTFRGLAGSQTEADRLRVEFRRLRGSKIMDNLPQGAASDADVALATSGVPNDNWSSAEVSSWLRGIAKIAEIEADFHSFRSDFISKEKGQAGFIKAWKEYSKDKYGNENPRLGESDSNSDNEQDEFSGFRIVN